MLLLGVSPAKTDISSAPYGQSKKLSRDIFFFVTQKKWAEGLVTVSEKV